MNLDMTMFHQAFFDEAADILSDLEGHLLTLESTPTDAELLNTIFRCAHSIKGGSATFGFTDIAKLTHSLETLLDQVRNETKPVTPTLAQVLFESLDQLKALLAVARGESAQAPDSTELIARIDAEIKGAAAPAAPSTSSVPPAAPEEPVAESAGDSGVWGVFSLPVRYRLRLFPGPDTLRRGIDVGHLFAQIEKAGEILAVKSDVSKLPLLKDMDPETCYLGWEIELVTDQSEKQLWDIFEFIAEESDIVVEKLEAAAEPIAPEAAAAPAAICAAPEPSEPAVQHPAVAAAAPPVKAGASPPAVSASETATLRVATEKVDKLINLVGELIINQSMLNEVVHGFTMQRLPRLTEAVAQMERASRELQERVMAVRLLPIKHAFGRFPRLVRDMSAKSGKLIELKTTGEETELDKTVIEAIVDPLTHLIRNSVDHGLEDPKERRAAGKPETGVIHLNAFQEGGNIFVEVADDGRGLDRARIHKKAVERGLIAEEDASLSDDAVYAFVFQPGFSTAEKVTEISGRGVGMDIVRQGIRHLGGTINLTSVPGQGTRFRIRLPLTMAILEGQSLMIGEEVYILPLTSIVESLRPRIEDVRRIVGKSDVVRVRGEIMPILKLHELFGSIPRITEPTDGLLVIVENDGQKVALLMDELIGQSQVVIKSLETNYRKVDGIAGATILGDGRVALIVDVPGLIRCAQADISALAA